MMRALTICLLSAGCAAPSAEPEVDARAALGLYDTGPREVARPFDETANAAADVEAALARASERQVNVILVLGGNWCPDSRSLAWLLQQPAVAPLVAERYEIVFVDVGYRDRNLDTAQRFGVSKIQGTPTVLVLSPEGTLLNGGSVEEWRTASQREAAEVAAYFSAWAGD
jgi:thiol-disulfide isomerase/thioredoxin